jgi:hypothetical protein
MDNKFEKIFFHVFLFGNGLNKFQFGIVHVMTYNLWNLKLSYPKLSYLNQFQWIIVIEIIIKT